MNVDGALQRLQAAEVQHLPLASLKTDAIYQPREAHMVPGSDLPKVERRSAEHSATMCMALEAATTVQLEPVLVAKVDGELCVVDGHHRLKAYSRTQRETIPARVLPMTKLGAVLVSKLVNCADRALEMHPEQRRDATWQYLAALTHRGAFGLPEGESLRAIAGRFGIGKTTVSAMLRKLPDVNPKDWQGAALDSGTGWPRWKSMKEWPQGDEGDLSRDALRERAIEKALKALEKVCDRTDPQLWDEVLRRHQQARDWAKSDPDNLAFEAEVARFAEETDF